MPVKRYRVSVVVSAAMVQTVFETLSGVGAALKVEEVDGGSGKPKRSARKARLPGANRTSNSPMGKVITGHMLGLTHKNWFSELELEGVLVAKGYSANSLQATAARMVREGTLVRSESRKHWRINPVARLGSPDRVATCS